MFKAVIIKLLVVATLIVGSAFSATAALILFPTENQASNIVKVMWSFGSIYRPTSITGKACVGTATPRMARTYARKRQTKTVIAARSMDNKDLFHLEHALLP